MKAFPALFLCAILVACAEVTPKASDPILGVSTKQEIAELEKVVWADGYAHGQKDGICMTLHQFAVELKRAHADRPKPPCTLEEWNHPWAK